MTRFIINNNSEYRASLYTGPQFIINKLQSVRGQKLKFGLHLPILNSIGTSRGSSRMFNRLFLRQQRAGYVYNCPGAWPEADSAQWFEHIT